MFQISNVSTAETVTYAQRSGKVSVNSLAADTYSQRSGKASVSSFSFDSYPVHHNEEKILPQSTSCKDINSSQRYRQHLFHEKVRINVSGKVFETFKSTLTSKKGSIFRLDNVMNYFDEDRSEFYFERNSRVFECILVYMQCGILQKNDKIPDKVFIEDLQFFGFGNLAKKYYFNGITRGKCHKYQSFKSIGLRRYIGQVLEHPDVNYVSRWLAMTNCFVIILSVFILCIETLKYFKSGHNSDLSSIEIFCNIWFTIELLVRFLCTDKRMQFLSTSMNIVDFLSILPFYVGLVLSKDKMVLDVLRMLRMLRLFRIFKLTRYSKAIRLILCTLKESHRELVLVGFCGAIAIMLFSSIIYFFENDPTDETSTFKSIPHVFWFSIVTITTVGYGDMVPATAGGKVIAAILSVSGILVIALPMPIIVNNFVLAYEKIMSNSSACRFVYDEKKSREVECETPYYQMEEYVTSL